MQCPNKALARAFLACSVGWALSLSAGEKVEIKGSTSIELPKPERKIQETTRFKLETGADELGGFAPPPNNTSSAPLDRKLKEVLDRKKNWIFVNPYERRMDDRTVEILGNTESTSPLLEHRLLQKTEKTAMEKFVEERGPGRRSSDAAAEGRGREPGDNAEAAAAGRADRAERAADEGGPRAENTSVLFLNERGEGLTAATGFNPSDFDKRMERTPLDRGFSALDRMQRPEVQSDDMKRQQETRAAEFEKLIQPRGLPGLGSGIATFEPSNPLESGRREEAGAFRRADRIGPGARVDFGGGQPGGVAARLPGENSDFGASASASQNTFLPNAGAAPAAPAAQMAPRPFVFEMPRRKF